MPEHRVAAPGPVFRNISDMEGFLAKRGAKGAHAGRLFRAWLGRSPWPDKDDLSLPLRLRQSIGEFRQALEAIARPVAREKEPGDAGSEKILLELSGGRRVEMVLLPRGSVCVSTQAGCAVGCVFCMTGRLGLAGQMGSAEIAAEAALARAVSPAVRKVDFMGMGEPSHNLDAVLGAAEFLGRHGGFAHKSLMISSVGSEKLFSCLLSLGEGDVRPALAVSLHSVSDEKRRNLLPRAPAMAVRDIMDAAEAYAGKTRYPVQYEWVLLRGVNDSADEIRELRDLMKGRFAMVNFIPANENPGSDFHRPEKEKCLELVRILRDAGIVAKIRLSAARGVRGGCGQLAGASRS